MCVVAFGEVFLMSTRNIYFCGETRKTILDTLIKIYAMLTLINLL